MLKDKYVRRLLRRYGTARSPGYQSLLRTAPRQYMRSRRGVRIVSSRRNIPRLPWQLSFILVNSNNRVPRSRKRLALSTRIPTFFLTQENSDRKDRGSCQRTPNSAACLADGKGSTTNSRRARRWRSSTSSWTFTRSSMSCRAVRSSSTSRPSTGEHFLFLHFFFYFYASSRLKDINNGRSEPISPQRCVKVLQGRGLLLQIGIKRIKDYYNG